jgi:hypothetical protein
MNDFCGRRQNDQLLDSGYAIFSKTGFGQALRATRVRSSIAHLFFDGPVLAAAIGSKQFRSAACHQHLYSGDTLL